MGYMYFFEPSDICFLLAESSFFIIVFMQRRDSIFFLVPVQCRHIYSSKFTTLYCLRHPNEIIGVLGATGDFLCFLFLFGPAEQKGDHKDIPVRPPLCQRCISGVENH